MLDRQHLHAARRFANATPAHVRVVAVEQPQFRDERGFHDSPMENPDHAALGHDNRNRTQSLRDRRGREMPAAKSQRQIDLLDRGIQIATCGDHEPRFGDHERTIELREFLDRASQVWIADVCPPGCMASQGIENQRPRRRKDGILGANALRLYGPRLAAASASGAASARA